jgi:hypothetical protein
LNYRCFRWLFCLWMRAGSEEAVARGEGRVAGRARTECRMNDA